MCRDCIINRTFHYKLPPVKWICDNFNFLTLGSRLWTIKVGESHRLFCLPTPSYEFWIFVSLRHSKTSGILLVKCWKQKYTSSSKRYCSCDVYLHFILHAAFYQYIFRCSVLLLPQNLYKDSVNKILNMPDMHIPYVM